MSFRGQAPMLKTPLLGRAKDRACVVSHVITTAVDCYIGESLAPSTDRLTA